MQPLLNHNTAAFTVLLSGIIQVRTGIFAVTVGAMDSLVLSSAIPFQLIVLREREQVSFLDDVIDIHAFPTTRTPLSDGRRRGTLCTSMK